MATAPSRPAASRPCLQASACRAGRWTPARGGRNDVPGHDGWTDLALPGNFGRWSNSLPHHPTQLISEIRDADGRILYEARPVPKPEQTRALDAWSVTSARNVVRWGTGRRALSAVKIGNAVVPVAGKTGTTNGIETPPSRASCPSRATMVVLTVAHHRRLRRQRRQHTDAA